MWRSVPPHRGAVAEHATLALRQTVHFACSSLREAGSCEVQISVASTARANIEKRTQVRLCLHCETCRHMLSEAQRSSRDSCSSHGVLVRSSSDKAFLRRSCGEVVLGGDASSG